MNYAAVLSKLSTNSCSGVNDAPSLKKADCGIAVEGASEAAQAAADIVFLAPGLSTIVLAIKTAREIFQRMKVSRSALQALPTCSTSYTSQNTNNLVSLISNTASPSVYIWKFI